MKTEIHPKFLEYPELVEARERAENAIIEYDKHGDVRCTNRSYGPYQLCVNVKVRRYPLHAAPEIKADMHERWYDMQAEDFWNLDFDGDCIAPESCVHEFPKFFSEGRSSGYFVFDGLESKRGGPAFSAYKQQANNYGGSGQTPRPEGNIDIALSNFDDVVDPFTWIEENCEFNDDKSRKAHVQEDVDGVTAAYIEMAEVFESAAEWAKVVKSQMEYRLDCYEGKDYYALESLADGEMYDFFDFTNVTVKIEGDECVVSWPQHARQFKDSGEWVDCEEGDEGAREWGTADKKPPGTKVWKKFVPSGPKCFELKMTRDELAEQLNEELHDAVNAIRKRVLKG